LGEQRRGHKPSPGDPLTGAIMLWLEDEVPDATRWQRQAAADRLRIRNAKMWVAHRDAVRPSDLSTILKNRVMALLPDQVCPPDLPLSPTSRSSSMGDAEVDDLLQEAKAPSGPPDSPDCDTPMPHAGAVSS
jgi:hypothetical protein